MRVLVASSNPHKLKEIAAIFEAQRQAAIASLDKLACLTGTPPPEIPPEVPPEVLPEVPPAQEGASQDASQSASDAPADKPAPPGLPAAVEWITLGDLGLDVPEPVEDQDTFEGNAVLKAGYYARASGLPTIADDSGLAVDALDGQPGVRSARFAGVDGPREVVDQANIVLLLQRLRGVPESDRQARFVCAMAMAWPAPEDDAGNDAQKARRPVVVRGEVKGRILGEGQPARGAHGFGYDPVFYLPDRGQTMAELPPPAKNALSHRGSAARLLWEKIHPLLTQ